MSEGALGLTEAVSIALGGLIGGDIYAVLGIVTRIATSAPWIMFLFAEIYMLCTSQSYIWLNEPSGWRGGRSKISRRIRLLVKG